MVLKQTNQTTSTFDNLKWGIVILLLAAGVFANHYFASQMLAWRVLAGLVLLSIVTWIASQTVTGRRAWLFAREAHIEMRKVVWPTRPETTQTTLIVVVMVIIVALLLWGVDSVLLWAI